VKAFRFCLWAALSLGCVSATAQAVPQLPAKAGSAIDQEALPQANAMPNAPAPLSPPDSAGRPPGIAVAFTCVLQVEESELAARALIAKADSLGGWFMRRSKSDLELRIPSARADSFIAGLAGLGVVLDRNLSTESLEGERAELTSRLKARRSMLQDYYAVLKESSDSTLFTIQNEIVNLQTEIEQTATQITKLEDRMAFARVTVAFRFFERAAPLTTGQSRFRWLNRLNLPTLMRSFPYANPDRQ
jgi:hypothetical protein